MEPTDAAVDTSTGDDAGNDDARPATHRPWWAPLTIAAFIALVICSRVADSVWSTWDNERPALLLALSSRIRFLLAAVAAGVGVVPYVVIASLRIAAAYAVCHLVGRAYREDVLRLFTRYLGLTPEAIEAYHKGLDKAEVVIVPFFAGSNIIAALTGVRRTPPGRLAILLTIGIAGRLALYWWLGKVFQDQIRDIMRFVDRYQLWAVLISIALVILVTMRNFRRGAKAG